MEDVFNGRNKRNGGNEEMKKKFVAGLVTGLFLVGMVGIAQATIIDIGNDVVYDDVSGLYWVNNLRLAGQYYDEAKEFYENMTRTISHDGQTKYLDTFHMATEAEYDSLMVNDLLDIAAMFEPSHQEGSNEYLWTGRYDLAHPTWANVHAFGGFEVIDQRSQDAPNLPISTIEIDSWLGDDELFYGPLVGYSWGVATYAAPVPEPATMLLFSTGLAGFVGSRLRRKKK